VRCWRFLKAGNKRPLLASASSFLGARRRSRECRSGSPKRRRGFFPRAAEARFNSLRLAASFRQQSRRSWLPPLLPAPRKAIFSHEKNHRSAAGARNVHSEFRRFFYNRVHQDRAWRRRWDPSPTETFRRRDCENRVTARTVRAHGRNADRVVSCFTKRLKHFCRGFPRRFRGPLVVPRRISDETGLRRPTSTSRVVNYRSAFGSVRLGSRSFRTRLMRARGERALPRRLRNWCPSSDRRAELSTVTGRG